MTWNYRCIVDEHKGEEYFQIHEVYYDSDGIPNAMTKEGVTVFSEEGLKGMKEVFKMMKEALKKPIIWGSDDRFPEEYIAQ